jgi:hypothetical protein
VKVFAAESPSGRARDLFCSVPHDHRSSGSHHLLSGFRVRYQRPVEGPGVPSHELCVIGASP